MPASGGKGSIRSFSWWIHLREILHFVIALRRIHSLGWIGCILTFLCMGQRKVDLVLLGNGRVLILIYKINQKKSAAYSYRTFQIGRCSTPTGPKGRT